METEKGSTGETVPRGWKGEKGGDTQPFLYRGQYSPGFLPLRPPGDAHSHASSTALLPVRAGLLQQTTAVSSH